MHEYRHGVVDRVLPDRSTVLPPDWAPQVPDDWREVLLRDAVPRTLAPAGRPHAYCGGKVSSEWQYTKAL
ncbi:hypothetical protein ACEZDB_03005 [Streptacidiphilus sp. N1-3]|uniref:Uncharacterized protein n=1 Tax=Streptacidiphilus alkalitolerans TaxID=3342712 RepID=A0ABV6WV42_9ACTN